MTATTKAEIASRILTNEAKMALLDRNKPEDSSFYQYYADRIKDLKYKLLKGEASTGKIKLHVAEESSCTSCEG